MMVKKKVQILSQYLREKGRQTKPSCVIHIYHASVFYQACMLILLPPPRQQQDIKTQHKKQRLVSTRIPQKLDKDEEITMTQLWDPLWEYVLEDYDSDEETRLGTWRRRRQQKQLQRQLKRQNLREEREREKQVQRQQKNRKKNKKTRKNNDDSLYASGSGSGGGALVSWDSLVSSKDGQDDVESTSNLLDQRNDESYDYDDIDDEDEERSVDDDDDDETVSHEDLLPSLDFAVFPNFFTNVTTDDSRQEQEQDQKEEDQRTSDLERNQQPRGNKSFWRRGSRQSQNKSNELSGNVNDDNFNNDSSNFWNIDFFDVRDDNNEDKRTPAAESALDSITPKVALHTPPPSNTKPKKGILRRTSTNIETEAGAGAPKEHPAISKSQRSIDTTGSTVTTTTSNSNIKSIHNLTRTFAQTFETNEDDSIPLDVGYDDDNDEAGYDDIEIVGARTYMTGQFKPFGRKRVVGDGTKGNYKVKSGGSTESPSQKASTSTTPSPSPALSNIEHGIQKSNSFNRRRFLSLRKNSSTNIQATVSNDDVGGQRDASTGDRSSNNLNSTPHGISVSKSSDNTLSHLDPVSSRNTSREIEVDDTQNANTVNSSYHEDHNVQKKKKQFLLRRQFRKATSAMRLGRSRSQNKNVVSPALDQSTRTHDGDVKLLTSETDTSAKTSVVHQPQIGTKALTPEDDTHSKSQAISDDGVDVDDFDPLMMFLEVAEKLAPWGDGSSDEDSSSDTTGSELAEQSATTDKDILSSPSFDEDSISQDLQDDSRNRHRTRSNKLDSLLDQKLPIVINQATTEIRLRINPVGDTLSEEIIRNVNHQNDFSTTESVSSSSVGDNKAEILAESSQISEDNLSGDNVSKEDQSLATSISVSRSSVQEGFGRRPSLSETTTSKVSALGTESATHQLEVSDTLMRRDNAIVRKKFPSDELKIPLDLKLERPIVVDSSRSDDAAVMGAVTDNTKSTQRGVFRRLACWKEAKMDEVEIQSKKKTDSVQGSSAKKIVAERQPQMIPKSATDLVNGIGAFSQEHAHQRGPHSLYSYDRDSTAHMDACYEAFGQRGRESVSVRQLGEPPISTEGSVVIQIEVRTPFCFQSI